MFVFRGKYGSEFSDRDWSQRLQRLSIQTQKRERCSNTVRPYLTRDKLDKFDFEKTPTP